VHFCLKVLYKDTGALRLAAAPASLAAAPASFVLTWLSFSSARSASASSCPGVRVPCSASRVTISSPLWSARAALCRGGHCARRYRGGGNSTDDPRQMKNINLMRAVKVPRCRGGGGHFQRTTRACSATDLHGAFHSYGGCVRYFVTRYSSIVRSLGTPDYSALDGQTDQKNTKVRFSRVRCMGHPISLISSEMRIEMRI